MMRRRIVEIINTRISDMETNIIEICLTDTIQVFIMMIEIVNMEFNDVEIIDREIIWEFLTLQAWLWMQPLLRGAKHI